MSEIEVMPEEDSAVTENGVWYIGNIAQAPVICRPGAIGLVPCSDSAAGPMVVMPNCASPVWTSAMFCIGPPVTSPPPERPSSSATRFAQPEP
jgi:hypothetical protein